MYNSGKNNQLSVAAPVSNNIDNSGNQEKNKGLLNGKGYNRNENL